MTAPALVVPDDVLEWTLTRHAHERARLRGFPVLEVLLAAARPDVSYEQGHRGPGAAIHQRGTLAVAVDTRSKTVVSVLHRRVTTWTDA